MSVGLKPVGEHCLRESGLTADYPDPDSAGAHHLWCMRRDGVRRIVTYEAMASSSSAYTCVHVASVVVARQTPCRTAGMRLECARNEVRKC